MEEESKLLLSDLVWNPVKNSLGPFMLGAYMDKYLKKGWLVEDIDDENLTNVDLKEKDPSNSKKSPSDLGRSFQLKGTEVYLSLAELKNGMEYIFSITSWDVFYYKNKNLIGMRIDEFKKLIGSDSYNKRNHLYSENAILFDLIFQYDRYEFTLTYDYSGHKRVHNADMVLELPDIENEEQFFEDEMKLIKSINGY